jgi:hypothetical protein
MFQLHREGPLCSCVPQTAITPQSDVVNQYPSTNRGDNSVSMTARQNLARGSVNQEDVEEAQDAPMNGTLLVNSYSVLTIP